MGGPPHKTGEPFRVRRREVTFSPLHKLESVAFPLMTLRRVVLLRSCPWKSGALSGGGPSPPLLMRARHQSSVAASGGRRWWCREPLEGPSARRGDNFGITMAKRCMSSSGNEIIYRLARPDQRESVMDLIYDSFFRDEPMTKALGIFDGTNRVDELSKYVEACLDENLSIVAMDSKTNQLLGISINGATHKDSVLSTPLSAKIAGLESHDFRHIIGLMHSVNEKAGSDIYACADVLFDVKIVTTDRHNRKGGLGTDLLARSFGLAKVLDFKGCKTEATGAFSRKAFEKNGFVPRAEVFYSEYTDKSGKKPFAEKDMGPHKCTTLLTKDLTKE